MNTPILVPKRLQYAKSKEEMEELLLMEELLPDKPPQNFHAHAKFHVNVNQHQHPSQWLYMANVERTSLMAPTAATRWITTATAAVTSLWT